MYSKNRQNSEEKKVFKSSPKRIEIINAAKANQATYLGEGYSLKDSKMERLPIGVSIDDSFRKGHFWCFGTTRSGKTRLMESMIVQDIIKGNSVVVIDPKGDIELLRNIIMTAFMTGRHRDLVFISSVYPEYSAKIDPLSYYYMPEELVGHIVSGVETGKEPFFYNVAYEISLMVVLSLLALNKKNPNGKSTFSLLDVKNIISHEDLSKLKNRVETLALTDKSLNQLTSDLTKILESPQDYYSKVSSSLRVALTELTSGNIGKIIGTADSNRFLKKLEGDDPMSRKGKDGKPAKTVIFVAQLGSLMTRKAAFTLGKIIISMIQSFTGRIFSSGNVIKPPLSLYIDEAQSVLYYGIEDLFAKGGGANVWIHGFSQSVNQMFAALGRDTAKSILDNTNTKIFMRVPDVDTAQYASDHFGKRKILSPILSSTGGISTREDEDNVVRYEEFLNLPPRLFYLMTYSGMFKCKTFDTYDVVSPFVQKFKIKFPDLKSKNKADQENTQESADQQPEAENTATDTTDTTDTSAGES
jgi:hypothetical protein